LFCFRNFYRLEYKEIIDDEVRVKQYHGK